MNTAARILEACRAADRRVLASAALLDRIAALPPGVTRRGLGELAMRGKEQRELADVRRRMAGRLKPPHFERLNCGPMAPNLA
jgi:hypothetical protein